MIGFEWDTWHLDEELESRPLTIEQFKNFKLYVMQQKWMAEGPTHVYINHNLKPSKSKNNSFLEKKHR